MTMTRVMLDDTWAAWPEATTAAATPLIASDTPRDDDDDDDDDDGDDDDDDKADGLGKAGRVLVRRLPFVLFRL